MIDETIDPTRTTQGFTEETAAGGERAGFCQDCGRPLTTDTVRRVGTGVFCEPCLGARMGASPTGAAPTGAGYTGAGAPPAGYPVASAPVHLPSPAAAGWLGLIPGVGAMYNGQFAKGAAHLVIFAILVSLKENVSDIFGLLVFGWICYQSFEAYHTAKARLLGEPLPNAFGLNDIGERVGFGKSWGNVQTPAGTPPTGTPGGTTPPASAAGGPPPANWFGYVGPDKFSAAPPPPAAGAPPPSAWSSYPSPVAGSPEAYAAALKGSITEQAYRDAGVPAYAPAQAYAPAPPYAPLPPYATPPAYAAAPLAEPLLPRKRFPVGAIWLIGLGVVFLAINIDPHLRLSGMWIASAVVGAVAVWGLARRLGTLHQMRELGTVGTARAISMVRWPLVLLVLAILFVLQAAHVFTLGQTWPVLLLSFGVLLLVERSAGRSDDSAAFPASYATVPPPNAGFSPAPGFHPSEAFHSSETFDPSQAAAQPTATDDTAKGGPQ